MIPTPRPAQPQDFASLGTPTSGRLAPVPGAFLRGDGQWVIPAGSTNFGMGSSNIVSGTQHMTIPAPPAYPWGTIIGLVLVIAYLWACGAMLLTAIAERTGHGIRRKVWLWPVLPFLPKYWRTDAVTGSDTGSVTDTEDWA